MSNGRGEFEPEEGFYAEGVLLTVTATPEEGYRFQGWIMDAGEVMT